MTMGLHNYMKRAKDPKRMYSTICQEYHDMFSQMRRIQHMLGKDMEAQAIKLYEDVREDPATKEKTRIDLMFKFEKFTNTLSKMVRAEAKVIEITQKYGRYSGEQDFRMTEGQINGAKQYLYDLNVDPDIIEKEAQRWRECNAAWYERYGKELGWDESWAENN